MKFLEKIDRTTAAWLAIVFGAVILLSVNLIASQGLKHVKADLTQESLFTISDGTRQVLGEIGEPISLKLYYSEQLGVAAPAYGKYFERVRALLQQYADISNGKLALSFVKPEPFSDAEDRAVAAELQGVRLNTEGDKGYFGLVGANSTDNQETIKFFQPSREQFLEYDLTKLIYALANPKKPVIGLLASIPINGAISRQGRQPPWLIMNQINETYTVRVLDPSIKEIPKDVDILMLAQPVGLGDQALYAIDQFALKGGKVLAFLDPVAEFSRIGPPGYDGAGLRGKIVELFKKWGVSFSREVIAGDVATARRVQFTGPDGQARVTDYVAWLTLGVGNLDSKDVLSGGIETLNFSTVGILKPAEGAGVKMSPILQTSAKAMEIKAAKARGSNPDAIGLLNAYKPGGKRLTIAARLSGEAQSLFAKGAPPEPKDAKKDPKKPADSAKPATPAVDKTKPKSKHLAKGGINVIVFADTDFLHDQNWAQVQNFFGRQVLVPNAQNAVLVLNALDNLTGSRSLLSLRGRGVDNRRFTLVDEIRRDAQRQYRQKEQALLARLKKVQDDLAKVERRVEGGELVLTDQDRATINRFRADMLEVRRELRSVKHALRKDIDQLDAIIKFLNIAGVPLLIGFGGLAVALTRRRKRGDRDAKAVNRQSKS